MTSYGFKGGIKEFWNHRSLTYRQNRWASSSTTPLHPELQTPVFNNHRLQYDDEVEIVQADVPQPDQEKSTWPSRFQPDEPRRLRPQRRRHLPGLQEQLHRLPFHLQGWFAPSHTRPGQEGRTPLWGLKGYSLDNDSVWVDVNDQVSIAGPHASQTYEDVFGVNFDHWRNSALNRDVLESNLEFSYRVSKTVKDLLLQVGLQEHRPRVLPGDSGFGRDHPQRAQSLLAGQTRQELQAHGALHAEIDNPYMLVDGAYPTLVSPSYANPWSPETPQYDEFQDARIAETTASPSSFDEAKIGFTWMIGSTTTLSANYKWWDGSNTDGDLTQWDRSNQIASVTLWSAPSSGWSWHLGYAYMDSTLNAPLCIPVFDG